MNFIWILPTLKSFFLTPKPVFFSFHKENNQLARVLLAKLSACNVSTSFHGELRSLWILTHLGSFAYPAQILMSKDLLHALWLGGLHKWCRPSEASECHCYFRLSACHSVIAVNAIESTFIWRPFDRGGRKHIYSFKAYAFSGRSLPIKSVLLSLGSYLGNTIGQHNPLDASCNPRTELCFIVLSLPPPCSIPPAF